jgi:hypothetical protein
MRLKHSLTGFKINNLHVIGPTYNEKRRLMWLCKCDCGTFTLASTHDLMYGHKKSCGCLKHKSNAEDLKGQRFGYLTVKKRVGTSEDRKALWRCKCDCGKFTTVRSVDLKSGNTKSCGCLGSAYAKRNITKGDAKK